MMKQKYAGTLTVLLVLLMGMTACSSGFKEERQEIQLSIEPIEGESDALQEAGKEAEKDDDSLPEAAETMETGATAKEEGNEASQPEEAEAMETGAVTEEELYEAFLKNEIGAANPYVEGMNLTVIDDENYETEFEDPQKKYAYVDVNGDEKPELIFKITSYPSELMYILGVYDNELICFDVFETHTNSMAFGVYEYGLVWEVQDYEGFGMTVYSYTADGQRIQARHFTEENRADIAAYEGDEPEWIDWQSDGNIDH